MMKKPNAAKCPCSTTADMKTPSSPDVTDESAASSGGSLKQDVSAKYVDCQCVACGWLDGFKPEAITQGMVGGWCDTCGRETVFRVSKPDENKYEAMRDLAACSLLNASRMAEAGDLKQAYMEAESGQRQLKAAIDANSPNDPSSATTGDSDAGRKGNRE